MNLNLNDQGQNYVMSLYKRDKARLRLNHEAKLDELIPQVGRVYGAEQILKNQYISYVQELVSARTKAYLEAYRKFNAELTESDIYQILKNLTQLVKEELKDILQTNREMTRFQGILNQQLTGMVYSAQLELEHAVQEMKLEAPIVEDHFIEPMPTVDFSFVADARIRHIVERDYAELQQLDPQTHSKSVLILAGGIIEGLLIDALITGEVWEEKKAFETFLKEMIYPAKNTRIIKHDNITEVLRVFRNLVHPAREIRDNLVFTADHAKHARTSVDVVISEVRQWHINNS